MAIETETLAQHVERCYRTQDWDGLARIYAPDVVLDVHVPMWRFQLQGPDGRRRSAVSPGRHPAR